MRFLKIALTGKNHILLYVGMMIVLFLATQLGSSPLSFTLYNRIESNPDLGLEDLNAFMSNPNFASFGIDPNLGFFLLLLSFVVGFLAFVLIFPKLHQRPFKTLITPNEKIDVKRILFGFFGWLMVAILIETAAYLYHPESFSFNFELKNFLPLLVLSLVILPLQTSLEELVFRSYLFQGIGNLKLNLSPKVMIIMAWIITSVLFGLIHGSNPEVQSFGIVPMMFYYIGAGLFLGALTIWDDRLELALGVHAATNFVGAVLVGYDGAAIQTESLFKTSEINVVHMTIGFYIGALIFILICKRKYGWSTFFHDSINNNTQLT